MSVATEAADSVLLEVKHLVKHFPVKKGVFGRVTGQVHAVDDVSFSVAPGETLGLVGKAVAASRPQARRC